MSLAARIGGRIRRRREELGLSQTELARRLDVSFQAVSKWERGENAPDIQILADLAAAVEVSIDWLFDASPRAFMKASPVFDGLSEQSHRTLLSYCEAAEYEPGRIIYENDANEHAVLYLLERGLVEVLKGGRVIAAPEAGMFFSDYSFFDRGPCVTAARVQGDRPALVHSIARPEFERYKREHPGDALIVYHNELVKAVGFFRETE